MELLINLIRRFALNLPMKALVMLVLYFLAWSSSLPGVCFAAMFVAGHKEMALTEYQGHSFLELRNDSQKRVKHGVKAITFRGDRQSNSHKNRPSIPIKFKDSLNSLWEIGGVAKLLIQGVLTFSEVSTHFMRSHWQVQAIFPQPPPELDNRLRGVLRTVFLLL